MEKKWKPAECRSKESLNRDSELTDDADGSLHVGDHAMSLHVEDKITSLHVGDGKASLHVGDADLSSHLEDKITSLHVGDGKASLHVGDGKASLHVGDADAKQSSAAFATANITGNPGAVTGGGGDIEKEEARIANIKFIKNL